MWYLVNGRGSGAAVPRRALVATALFGLAAVGVAALLELYLLPREVFDNPAAMPLHKLAWATLVVGVIEEGAKSVPLALFLYNKPYFTKMTDGVVYFGIVGMIFGMVEDIVYALTLGPTVGILRIVVSPFIHAAFCVFFGWALAWVKVHRKLPIVIVDGAVLAVGAHALYDLGLLYGRWWSVLGGFGLALVLNLSVIPLLQLAQRMDASRISAKPLL
jgi:RsiW-degrading membrane proteinase PrsW (M82 family)